MDLDQTISELTRKVSEFTGNYVNTVSDSGIIIQSPQLKYSSSFLSQISNNSGLLMYLIIPVIVFVLFYIWKPSCIQDDITVDEEFPEYKLNYKKILLYTVIISIIIILAIFGYFYKKLKG